MKFVVLVGVLCLASPAFAQTTPAKPAAKPAAAKPAAAKPKAEEAAPAKPTAAQKSAYDAMTLAERIAIQTDLISVGDLKASPTGEWGTLSNAAAKAFQKRKGYKDTGILLPEERAALAADAKAKQDEAGWRIVDDFSGARVSIPTKLAPQASKGKSGGHWQSSRGEVQIDVFREPAPATLSAVHEIMRKDRLRRARVGPVHVVEAHDDRAAAASRSSASRTTRCTPTRPPASAGRAAGRAPPPTAHRGGPPRTPTRGPPGPCSRPPLRRARPASATCRCRAPP